MNKHLCDDTHRALYCVRISDSHSVYDAQVACALFDDNGRIVFK